MTPRRWPCGALMDPSERDAEPDTDYCPDCESGACAVCVRCSESPPADGDTLCDGCVIDLQLPPA